jgi:serine protease Do
VQLGEIAERLRRSTVHIRKPGRRGGSAGSGIIWRGDGAIVTNAHVVDDGKDLSVELWDGRSLPAEMQGADGGRDLAQLKVAAAGLPSLEFRDTPARAGEVAIAIGNPLGFTGALTRGVVRGFGAVSGLGGRSWVQADVQLAPGNSGGPLADADGKLIGINTMIVRGGIALAVPAPAAREFTVNGPPPRLGVTVREVNFDGNNSGLLILGIERHSPAEKASLLIGDILTRLDGARLENYGDLADALARGGPVRVEFLRGDRSRTREVVVTLRGPAATGFAA